MQHISPRFGSTFDGKPWPPETPHWHHDNAFLIPIIIGSVFYTFGFVIACCVLTGVPADSEAGLREKPWIPARIRGDACLTPIFFVLPAFLWPLIFPYMILGTIYLFLKCVVYVVWGLISPATTCCGIPLPRRWFGGTDQNAATASSSDPDLEMGPVVACAEDGEGGESGSGVGDSDPAGVRSAGSGESERPPSYTSQPPDEDEDDKGETDGLLAKSKNEVETDEH